MTTATRAQGFSDIFGGRASAHEIAKYHLDQEGQGAPQIDRKLSEELALLQTAASVSAKNPGPVAQADFNRTVARVLNLLVLHLNVNALQANAVHDRLEREEAARVEALRVEAARVEAARVEALRVEEEQRLARQRASQDFDGGLAGRANN